MESSEPDPIPRPSPSAQRRFDDPEAFRLRLEAFRHSVGIMRLTLRLAELKRELGENSGHLGDVEVAA